MNSNVVITIICLTLISIASISGLFKIQRTLFQIIFSVILVASVTFLFRIIIHFIGFPFKETNGEEIAILAGLAAMAIGILHVLFMGKETHALAKKSEQIESTLIDVQTTQSELNNIIQEEDDSLREIETTQITLADQIKKIEDTQRLLDKKADERLSATMNLTDYLGISSSFYSDGNVELVITHITVWKMEQGIEQGLLNSQAKKIIFIGDITDVDNGKIEGVLWRINKVEEANKIRRTKRLQEIIFNSSFLGSPGFVYAERNGQIEVLIRPTSKNEDFPKAFGFHLAGKELTDFLKSLKSSLIREQSVEIPAHIAFLQLIKKRISDNVLMQFRQKIIIEGLQNSIPYLVEQIVLGFNLHDSGKRRLEEFFDNCTIFHSEDLYGHLIDQLHYDKKSIVMRTSFTDSEVREAKSKGELLRLAIETWPDCNFHCVYCYSGNNGDEKFVDKDEELILTRTKKLIDQAHELGARVISLLGGGEPFVNQRAINIYSNLVDYIASKNMGVVIFTNGSHINETLAESLAEKENLTVIVKLHSLHDPSIHNNLCNGDHFHNDWFTKTKNGIDLLINAGLNQINPKYHSTRLAIESVIVKENIKEIPYLWEWARQHNIFPYIELTKFQGRAKLVRERLEIDQQQVKNLFLELQKIDKKRGIEWELSSPFPGGMTCRMFHIGAYINYKGDVQPCVGVVEDNPYNVFTPGNSLGLALQRDEFRLYRNIKNELKGKCKECPDQLCYGCRAHGFWDTKNENMTSLEKVIQDDTMCPRDFN